MISLLVLLAATATSSPIPDHVPAEAIPNYRIVEPGLAAGGQPSAEALAKLKGLGFKTVINLRPEDEAPVVATEKKVVEAQGLRYVSVPVTPGTFSAADVDRIVHALDDTGAAPVLLHCASGNRVGAVWGVIMTRRGASLPQAEAEAKRVGLSSEAMVEAFRRVAAPSPSTKP